jgi:phage shock protein PspC (stress-responsive transcriptional regulator)
MHGGKEVINAADINEVIVIMGQPEDYITEDLEDEPRQQNAYQEHKKQTYTYTKRRLYRDTDENMIGGVASGIGYYFGIDPLWIRLAFVLAVFLGFSGFLIYVILWIIMPEARSSSEKLAMKGEPVTFENIGKTVEDEIKNVKKKLNNLDGNYASNVQSAAKNSGNFVLSILKFAIKSIGKILGVLFIIGGVIILFSVFFGAFIPFNILFVNALDFPTLIFASGADFWLTIIGSALLIGVPLLALILAGIILLFNARMPKYTGLVLAVAWVSGIVLSAIVGISTGLDFSKESTVSQVSTLQVTSDTLYFDILDSKDLILRSNSHKPVYDFFETKNGELTTDGIGVDVMMTKSTSSEIEIIKTARGKSHQIADNRAEALDYKWIQDSNIISIDPYINLLKGEKWRAQEIKVILYLPIGKTIFIPKSYKYLLDDVKNYHDTYDQNMVEMYWTMTDSGLISTSILNREGMESLIQEDEDLPKKIKVTVSADDEEHSIIIE